MYVGLQYKGKIFFDPRHCMPSDRQNKNLKNQSEMYNMIYRRYTFTLWLQKVQIFRPCRIMPSEFCNEFTALSCDLKQLLTQLIRFICRSRITYQVLEALQTFNFSQRIVKIVQVHKHITPFNPQHPVWILWHIHCRISNMEHLMHPIHHQRWKTINMDHIWILTYLPTFCITIWSHKSSNSGYKSATSIFETS